jgi:hypothetical protein
MGYSTDFDGEFKLTPFATPEQVEYINKFIDTRRMGRKVDVLMEKFKGKFGLPLIKTNLLPASETSVTDLVDNGNGEFVPVDRTAAEIYGVQGEFFIGDENTAVIDHNRPPTTQPGLWCQWTLDEDGTSLQWDGGEKFYSYVEWLQYMITNFFSPWGIMLNGEVEWSGEESSDLGKIIVVNNVVTVKQGTVNYN